MSVSSETRLKFKTTRNILNEADIKTFIINFNMNFGKDGYEFKHVSKF